MGNAMQALLKRKLNKTPKTICVGRCMSKKTCGCCDAFPKTEQSGDLVNEHPPRGNEGPIRNKNIG